MKGILIAFACAVACGGALARGGSHGGHSGGGSHHSTSSGGSHHVAGHTTKDGKYIPPHETTNPNDSKRDNWSSKGNSNPYTGKAGTKDPDSPSKRNQ